MSSEHKISNHKKFSDKYEDRFAKYVIMVIINIILALFLGIMTNKFINYIGNKFNWNFHIKIIFQIIIVALVIDSIKKLSEYYIHHELEENYSYGVIFISVYMGSQINFQELLQMFK
jgi:hypothetical protein